MTSVVGSGIIIGRVLLGRSGGIKYERRNRDREQTDAGNSLFHGSDLCRPLLNQRERVDERSSRTLSIEALKPCNGRPSGLIGNSERRPEELNHHVAIGQTSRSLRSSLGAACRTRVVDGARAGGAGCGAKAGGRADPWRNAQ